ncbi:MAG TPA: 50S ribosomal protein L25/general stress protein Ctc [Actinomycetes bacterium]|nr:50S ribosomal protein L25/general stress protein Ctc [Actinomycetes bacterium]
MSEVRIKAELRTEFGKGAARRTRRAGKVPAVLYGHGAAPRHIALPGHELMLALKTPNVLLDLAIDGKSQLALPKDVQRHPVRRHLEHVDLIVVRRGEKVRVEVPVRVIGEVAPGGLLAHELTAIPVEAEATAIPPQFQVDVEGLEVGAAIHASNISLPDGVTLLIEPERSVVHVMPAPTAEQMEAEGAGEVPEAPEVEEEAEAEVPEGERPEAVEGAQGEGEKPETPAQNA